MDGYMATEAGHLIFECIGYVIIGLMIYCTIQVLRGK